MVVSIRRKIQGTMREDLVSGIELLTGRKALSFMSDHDAHPRIRREVLLLDAAPVEQAPSADTNTPL